MNPLEFLLIIAAVWFIIKLMQAAISVGEDKEKANRKSDPARGSRDWYAKVIEANGGQLIGFGCTKHPSETMRSHDKFYMLVRCPASHIESVRQTVIESTLIGVDLTVIFENTVEIS